MREAIDTTTTSRRRLLATSGMGAMLLLTAAEAGSAKAAELDRELLTCCAHATELEKRADALIANVPNTSGPIWDDHEAMVDECCGLFERAAALPARSPEGLRAKARIILARQDIDDGLALEVAVSLARDVLGRAGA